jgi:hypothetical protein
VFEFEAEGFDDEVVVFALSEAGDGDAADNAASGDVDGEAAAVGGVVGVGKVVALVEGAVGLLEREADGVGASMEAGDDIAFALDPAGIVGCCSGECGVEEGLVGIAKAADVDDDGVLASGGQIAEAETEAPGSVVVEAGEAEFGFLSGDDGEVFGEGHSDWLLLYGRSLWLRVMCVASSV